MMIKRKAVIFGIKGYKLSNKERIFLSKVKPWGIILFNRNIKNILQLKFLINDIKKIFKDNKYPILIDEEGGKVSRLNKIIDLSIFSQSYFSKLYSKDKKTFFNQYKIYIDTVCNILKDVGININTVPVLDVRRKITHNVIGNRSFSSDPNLVSKLGNLCVNFYNKNKIATIMKHIPGHGLAKSDSHYSTPKVKTNTTNLRKKDFKPFTLNNSLFAMTAHVIYESYDQYNTATHSKIIIQKVIRNYMRFKGILISDDISMKSLKYSLEVNVLKALSAGCNLVLHCNGNITEMNRIAKVIPVVDNFVLKKTSDLYRFLI